MNPAEPVIRKASFSDGPAIFRCIKAHPNELVPRPLSDVLLHIDRFLVAELAGEIVGTASWAVLPELEPGKNPSIEIQSVSVRDDFQKQGLGRRLVEAAIARVAEFQPYQIIVLTFTPPFFASLGFVPVSKEKLLYKLYKGCMNCAKYDNPLTCPEVAMAYDPARAKGTAS
ncbi:MAG: GNAT family N-acetyltransferase [Spartobacteria bacterium]|nr:GNAT family N-acetyltransferase [Spartobacteria bacterium]